MRARTSRAGARCSPVLSCLPAGSRARAAPRSRPSRSTTTPSGSRSPPSARLYEPQATRCRSRRRRARRRHAAHVGDRGNARHQPRLVRVRAAQHHRQADRALAGGRPLQHRSAPAWCGPTSTRGASSGSRHSVGYVPERIKSDRADVFRLTLEPGQTVTFVAELASDRFARLYPVEARSSTSRRAATASSSTASCWASPACSPSS